MEKKKKRENGREGKGRAAYAEGTAISCGSDTCQTDKLISKLQLKYNIAIRYLGFKHGLLVFIFIIHIHIYIELNC